MKRGNIWKINLESASLPEFGKVRLGIIISNSDMNLLLPTVLIIPVSSRPPDNFPLRVEFKMPDGRFSYAVVPGMRQIKKERLAAPLGLVDESTIDKLFEAISIYLRD